MLDDHRDEIRSGVQSLVDASPPAPGWDRVLQAGRRRRSRRIVAIGTVVVLAALAGVALVSAEVGSDELIVAGPEDGRGEPLGCGPHWIAVHTLFDSSANSRTPTVDVVAAVTAEQAAFLVKSGDVPDRVAAAIGGDAAELVERVVVRFNANLGTIEITARGEDPGAARRLADAFADALLASVSDILQRAIDRDRDVWTAQIAQFERDLAGVVGDDRASDAARERLQGAIEELQVQLRELDQRAAQGTNIYSFGSSEPFQVTGTQLDTLMDDRPQPGTRFMPEGDVREPRQLGRDHEDTEEDC
jgi:hypothetical protein